VAVMHALLLGNAGGAAVQQKHATLWRRYRAILQSVEACLFNSGGSNVLFIGGVRVFLFNGGVGRDLSHRRGTTFSRVS
jgi:hypothetical protein